MPESWKETFVQMASAFPVRTSLFTIGPLLFAIVQLANSYVNGASVLGTTVFTAILLLFAVHVNRYHLASFRRTAISRQWVHGD